MPSNLRRGFTLLEMVAVMAIIAALTAIITPVYSSAVLAAKAQSSIQKLKQWHLAIRLYQDQWDFKGYDSVEALALPDPKYFLQDLFPAKTEVAFASPCGYHWSFDSGGNGLGYYYSLPLGGAISEYQRYRQNSVILMDFQCNNGGVRVADPLERKLGLGLLLSGQVTVHYRTGDVLLWKFYTQPPD